MRRALAAAAAVGVLATGCGSHSGGGGGAASERDVKACGAVAGLQQRMDASQGQADDGRAALVADYIAIPKTLPDGGVDDAELKEALVAARMKQPEAEGTIPVEGAKVMAQALKPFRERCAELGATAAASAAAVSPSVSPPQVIDWSSSTVSPYTPPAPPVPAGMARVVMEVDTPDGRATMADLTVGEGGKISQHEGVDVPLTMKSDGRRGLALVRPIGEFVQLTAQNRMDSGSISCRILASDGSVISENVSSGGYVVVGCQGRAR